MRPEALTDVVAAVLAGLRGLRHTRGRALVLAYHNVVPDDCPQAGDVSLHLPLRRFVAQLDALAARADIVALEDALRPSSPDAPPRVALTFDDAYVGAVTLALPELRQRGLPATVFVAPGLLGSAATWWDALAHEWLGGSRSELRQQCLDAGACEDDVRTIAAAAGAVWRPVRREHAIATEAQLREACYAGLTLGAHTWHHVNLAAWREPWREPELDAPLRWLRAQFPREARPWLALPFGCSSTTALQAIGEAGYERCFRVEGGWRGTATAPLAEPRLNVPSGATAPRLLYHMSAAHVA